MGLNTIAGKRIRKIMASKTQSTETIVSDHIASAALVAVSELFMRIEVMFSSMIR